MDLQSLIKEIIEFRDERDWGKFHNPKDLALSLTLEAAEVLEHFQWKSQKEVNSYIESNHDEIGEELADVLYWVLLMSYDLNIDILSALSEKMKVNRTKYPISKSKGISTKYNKL